MGSRRAQWWPLVLLVALTVSVLGVVLALRALDAGDKVASIVSCLVGVVTLGLTWATSRTSSRVGDTAEESARLSLREQAAEYVDAEVAARGLLFPEPLRVPWSSVNGPVAASPDVVLGRLQGVRRTALRLHGDVTMLACVVAALPTRQVVLLGSEGSGKTSTTLLLARRLLEEGKIPVLLDMAGWAANRQRLDDYLVGRMKAVLPAGLSADAVRRIMSRLVGCGTLVPVLDGLDEMAPQLREGVIKEVQTWKGPFVLTSQLPEYEAAVRAAGVTVARALVVRLHPLPVAEITAHLTAGRVDARCRWNCVAARLSQPGALREVLSSPLMSDLARKAYASADSNPGELLSFNTADALERHLVEAVHRRDDALEWLTNLARYLSRREVRHIDLANPLTPAGWRRYRRAAVSLVVTAVSTVFAALYGSQIDWRLPHYDTAVASASWVAVLVGFVVLRLAYRSRVDTAGTFRFKLRLRRMLGGAASAVGVAMIMNVMVLLSPSSNLQSGGQELILGVIAVTLLVAVFGLFGWGSLTEPVAENQTPQPLTALRQDRTALVAHFPLPLLGAAAYCATIGGWAEFYGTVALFLLASTSVGSQVPGAAWSRWALRHVLLARSVPTPGNDLGKALENARTKGVLRASGTSYRFQHTKIHDHLTRIEQSEPRSR